jgi:hypothetical protein
MNPPITASNASASMAHGAADRRLARAPLAGAERVGQRFGQVSDPFGDRDERAGPGRDRAHRHGEQHDQPMPDPACLTGINHSAQGGTQGRGEHHRIR